MSYELGNIDFCGEDAPWCYFASAPLQTADSFAHYFGYWHPIENQQVVVRVLQGRRCETPQSLFQEWSAALQFPAYFGENWDAMDECLTDLEWLPGACYVFFVMQIDRVLPGLDGEFNTFIHVLRKAHQEWKIPNRYNTDWPAAPFTLVFHAEPDKSNEALARLGTAGADPVVVRFSDEFTRLTTDRA